MRDSTTGRRGARIALRPRTTAIASLAAVGLVLAACSSGGSSTESSSAAPESSAATPTSEAPAEPVELWVQSGNGGADALLAGYEALNAAFEALCAKPAVSFFAQTEIGTRNGWRAFLSRAGYTSKTSGTLTIPSVSLDTFSEP